MYFLFCFLPVFALPAPAARPRRQPLGHGRFPYGAASGRAGRAACFRGSQGGVDRAGLDGELPVYAAGRLGGTPVLLPVGDVRQFVGLQDRQRLLGCRPGWCGRIALHGDAVQPVGLLDRLVRMFPVKPDVGVVARLACVKATYR